MPDNAGENRGKAQPPEDYRFKPGQSGNPKGRPRGAFSLTAALKKKLKQKVPGNKDGYTWGNLLVERTLVLGAKGNSTALKEVWGRVEDAEGAIKLGTFRALMEQMALVVARHVNDADTLRAIEQEWSAIRVDGGGNPGR